MWSAVRSRGLAGSAPRAGKTVPASCRCPPIRSPLMSNAAPWAATAWQSSQQPEPPKTDRGTCPTCHRSVALKGDDCLRSHKDTSGRHCPDSGRKATEIVRARGRKASAEVAAEAYTRLKAVCRASVSAASWSGCCTGCCTYPLPVPEKSVRISTKPPLNC